MIMQCPVPIVHINRCFSTIKNDVRCYNQRLRGKLIVGACLCALIRSVNSLAVTPAELRSFQVAQVSTLSAWRPYANPDRLISVGMNKGQVLSIAGKPDHEESYYQGGRGGLTRISDWYYIRSGFDAQTTILKFAQESLVNITTTSTR
jgi:hypothetical protein